MSSIEMSNIKRTGEQKTTFDQELDEMFGEDTGRIMTEEEVNKVIAEGRIRNPEMNEFWDILENQDQMITESQDILAETFDVTGDESLLEVQKMYENIWAEQFKPSTTIKKGGRLGRWDTGETKSGEIPPQEELGDLSDLFQVGTGRRTTFLEQQLNRFRNWRENVKRARYAQERGIRDELDDYGDLFPDLEEAEEEIVLYDREAEDALARMNEPAEVGDVEMTTRGDPREYTGDEGDLFDNMFGETKTSGNMMEDIMGEGELPPEIAGAGTAEDLGIIMESDDLLRVGGEVIDLETLEGTEMLSKIASAVGEYSETSAAVSRGLSLAGDVLGVVGVGLAVGTTIYQIYDGIATEEKYEEAGDTYITMGQDIEKINGALRMSYNTKVKQQNAYTELYTKWVFNKNNPDNAGKGRQMPLFNYSSDFNSITEGDRMDKISTFMISSIIQKQQADLSKLPPAMRIGFQLIYNKQNEQLKNNIIQGLDRVSQGEENTKWNWLKDMVGVDPDSVDDLRSIDIKAQQKGGVRLKRIYDAYREMDLRNRFMKKVYQMDRTSYDTEGKSRRIELGSMDDRILSHYEEQTKDDPQFQTALQARTDQINNNFKWRVDREYAQHFQDVNVKWKKQEDMLKGLPANIRGPAIRMMEERRKAEWKMWNKKKQKAYGSNLSTEQVLTNNYPKKYEFMFDLKKERPYWIEYFQKNRPKYYRNDMNEILSNRKTWLEGSDERRLKPTKEDTAPKPYTGRDDSDDYNPFIDPTTDIKRKINPKWKPPKPIQPKPKKPADEPIEPKPKPIPRRRPKRVIPKTGQKRLLGQEDLWDFEPEKDNEFDEDIGFDIHLAQHLLHLCEHSYKSFDDDYFPTNTDMFDYDVATTMGGEGFGVTEQGRMYYSSRDNVISITYRGTDFGRTYNRPDLFIADLINDMDMRRVQYEGLIVHSGFLDFYLKTQDEVMTFINAHINKDTLIYTTGHSYGAIPSMILAYMLNKHYEERRAICYTFGSPRGFDRQSVQTIASQLTAFRVADIQDPITLLPPSSSGYFHAGRTIYLDGKTIMKEIISMDDADSLYNVGGSSVAKVGGILALMGGINLAAGGIMKSLLLIFGAVKIYSFVELNKHALEKYDELLGHHNEDKTLNGTNVRTETEMLKGMDALKDNEGNFYSTTPDEFDNTPIFTQTDNDHLKFIPKYHRDTGITMMPIPHDLRGAIIGFTILSDEQINSPNMLKGLVVY